MTSASHAPPLLFTVRRAVSGDAESLRVGCRAMYSTEQISAWAAVPMPEGFVATIGECVFLVAEAAGELLGFAFMTLATSTIDGIFVSPSTHRRGIGVGLLQELERCALQAGLEQLGSSSTLNAEAFYTRNGYRVVERTRWMHPDGFELPSILMKKALGPRGVAPDGRGA